MDVFRESRGQMTLSFILLVSGIIIEIAIAAAFVAYFSSVSIFGERFANRAHAAAETGVRDVQMKLARNSNLVQVGTMTYTMNNGFDSVTVEVSRITTQPTAYIYTATSTGTAGTRSKRFSVVITVDKITGVARLVSFSEFSLQ